MAVRGTNISKNFEAIKRQNPGISDSAAMQRAIKLGSASTAKEVAATAKLRRKRKPSKIKMIVTGKLSKKFHSPAGRKHLKRKKKY